ncbi:MAG: hypothetical protein MUC28_03485, partial [Planctomycetes bacterium]|nr:hypothetical protein [Planctomycetota bacterium]
GNGQPASPGSESKTPLPPKVDINEYHDPEGLTARKMNIGLWLIEHRREIFTIPVVALAVIGVITWLYSIYGFGYYLVKGREEDRMLVKSLLETNIPGHDYFLAKSARPILAGPAHIIAAEDGDRYDFYSEVKNPNQNHWGYFNYSYTVDGKELPQQKAFILPGESKYIYNLNQELKRKPSSSRLNIYSVAWQRIDRHVYPDWASFASERLAITVENIKFLPAKSTLLSEKLNINELTFSATNQTAFNYREVNFLIMLMRQDEIIGVNVYVLRDFLSGQSRAASLAWPGRLGRVDEVKIRPELDITQDDIYIKFTGDQSPPGQIR